MNSSTDDRRSPRRKIMLSGVLEWDGRAVPVRLADLSDHGALIQSEILPPIEAQVLIRVGDALMKGWINWSRENFAGIQFSDAIDSNQVKRMKSATLGMIIENSSNVSTRRPGFRGNQLTPEEQRIVRDLLGD